MSDPLGLRFVASITINKKLSALAENRIKDTDIFDEAREALRFVKDYLLEFEEYPKLSVIEETVKCNFEDEIDAVEYLVKSVKRRALANNLEGLIKEAIKSIEHRRPEDALVDLSSGILGLRADDDLVKITSYRDTTDARIKIYEETKETEGLIGIRTPWPTLNKEIQGWIDGGFHVIAGMTGTGKTWILSIVADYTQRILHKKVLFVTMEMSSPRIGRRLDCIRFKLPFGPLRDAELDFMEEDRWKEEAEKFKAETEGPDILIADKKLIETVDDVEVLIREHKPELVLIDGGYRLRSGGKGSWEEQKEIVRSIQKASELTNIPWVVTTQFGDSSETGRTGKKAKDMVGWNVRYGKEWVIDPDVLIGIQQTEDMRFALELEMGTLKVRDGDGPPQKWKIKWDREAVDFEEIEEKKDIEELDLEEVVKAAEGVEF